jgi:hypothetical protein
MSVSSIDTLCTPETITGMAKALFKEERAKKRLDGWFLAREIAYQKAKDSASLPAELRAAEELKAILENLPLSISRHAVFAGTQSDAFARSYALINPAFEVETFSGYCDPTAVYGDIVPDETLTRERIDAVCEAAKQSDYVKTLAGVYDEYAAYTGEVAFFIEQVTGHLIPDFRPVLAHGVQPILEELDRRIAAEPREKKRINYTAMKITLEALLTLAGRYADIAAAQKAEASPERAAQLDRLESTLRKVPARGAENLYEAIQSFLLLWEVMCLEQAPNPFAFSVGNADRIFEPYRRMGGTSREEAAALFKHFLAFFNVGDRSWAISQNVLIGGRDNEGRDLTNETSYALLDAYYDMNVPQPILSVKLHRNTPAELYEAMGRFFFTPGCLTPSLFNDDALFEVLRRAGVEEADLPDYAVAGCQEPLIMGKDNGNTTNSWLNMPKILELTLNGGVSTVTGERIGTAVNGDFADILTHLRERFYENAAFFVGKMTAAANGASQAVSCLPVPFLSVFMGGLETGIDTRDTEEQGTKYNGSGCLIHGLSVMADSFIAVDHLLKERPEDVERLHRALQNNFEGDEELRQYLLSCPKFGNNIPEVDEEARRIAEKISDLVASQKNYLGNPFRPDWSSPSTHLLYGYWVGATPDGRKARDMLGYGVDPLYGEAGTGLGFRVLSGLRLPYEKFAGGYASHFGIDPKYFKAKSYEERGMQFAQRVIQPLFFNEQNQAPVSPFYLYVNVTTPDTLRKVLAEPEKYAPSGVYIMRIHGTFVNFLDLSPAIQADIIKRLDLESTAL